MIAIKQILINHLVEPIGFALDNHLHIEFSAVNSAAATATQKRLVIQSQQIDYDSAWQNYEHNFFDFELGLKPRTRYKVTIMLKNPMEEVTRNSFFETGKMTEPFQADWIGSKDASWQNTLLCKDFTFEQELTSARLYISGLGVYEAYLNQHKIGTEFLAPGVTAYDQLVQVQTYDVAALLQKEHQQQLLISLGDGWYKGNFGFDGGQDNIYGDQQMAICELHLQFANGQEQIIKSDESWQTAPGKITKSAIYYGEDFDDTRNAPDWQPAVIIAHDKNLLHDRLSLPLKINEYLTVKQILQTPAGETVLDFGQNHAGWPEFINREPAGTTIKLEMGEILQDGNFYRANLRKARAAFCYTSNGTVKWVRPHFTYYGYRYVKISGNTQPLKAADFRSAVIYTAMERTGEIQTDNAKVNRFLENVIWSQKSNFFDVPTDCPQRDERLGWSGDADIFASTAVLNMATYPFFKKYAKDMQLEQQRHDGMLTMYAPAMGNESGGAAIWGDAATVIPWTVYRAYGDPAILRQNYASMRAWVDWISRTTTTPNLWTGSFQFGDWLALDGENPAMPTGKTDEDFIASVYYYYSSSIVAQTAAVLADKRVARQYADQATAIKQAIRAEYLTATGRLAIDTQTAYALALHFDLVPSLQRKRVVNDLIIRLAKDNNHLKTGFVGTPLVCSVLSENGHHELATQIFLNEDFPSWLYAVNLGATTVWERWNSVLTDGSMNPEGMNSLNHYSIGAIMQWVYQYVLGLRKQTDGYQQVTYAPQFDYRFKQVNGHYRSSYGDLTMAYRLETDKQHTIQVDLTIPFGQTVTVNLPRVNGPVLLNGHLCCLPLTLTNGTYSISYQPQQSYIKYYQLDMPIKQLMADHELVEQLLPLNDVFAFCQDAHNLATFGNNSLVQLNSMLPFIKISAADFTKIKAIMAATPLASERKFLHERRTV